LRPNWNIESQDLLLLISATGSTQCYRMVNGEVEFQRHPYSLWEQLAPAQLLQHLWVETLVSDWLRRRSRYVRARAAEPRPETARLDRAS
jgi:hypothetical protein